MIAWNLEPEKLPEGPAADDVNCMCFWEDEARDYRIGKGATPQEAYENLIRIVKGG